MEPTTGNGSGIHNRPPAPPGRTPAVCLECGFRQAFIPPAPVTPPEAVPVPTTPTAPPGYRLVRIEQPTGAGGLIGYTNTTWGKVWVGAKKLGKMGLITVLGFVVFSYLFRPPTAPIFASLTQSEPAAGAALPTEAAPADTGATIRPPTMAIVNDLRKIYLTNDATLNERMWAFTQAGEGWEVVQVDVLPTAPAPVATATQPAAVAPAPPVHTSADCAGMTALIDQAKSEAVDLNQRFGPMLTADDRRAYQRHIETLQRAAGYIRGTRHVSPNDEGENE